MLWPIEIDIFLFDVEFGHKKGFHLLIAIDEDVVIDHRTVFINLNSPQSVEFFFF